MIDEKDIDRIAQIIVNIEEILERMHDLGFDGEFELPLTKDNMTLMARADQMRKEALENG